MLRIGEFSKLSLTTVKALRFYEHEGLLSPASLDRWTGYRYYDTSQLVTAAKIKSYRQMGLSIEEIKRIFSGEDPSIVLAARSRELRKQIHKAELQLSIIDYILEGKRMKYQVTMKELPGMIVYSSETVLEHYSDAMQWIPSVGVACMRLNPGMKCAEPSYEFCEYLDGEYRESQVWIRHSEAVTAMGRENEEIYFRVLSPVKILSIYHKGSYDTIGEAYAYILEYAEQNGYQIDGLPRESYIDGIWNKERTEDWLTEIQLPIK